MASKRKRSAETRLDPAVVRVLTAFRVVFATVRRQSRNVQDKTGLSALQLRALAEIAANDDCLRVTGLAKSLHVHQPSATKLVDELEAKRLVARRRSSVDGRIVELCLAPAGRKLLASAPAPVIGVLPDALSKLGGERLAQLDAVLTDLLRVMKRRELHDRFEPLDS